MSIQDPIVARERIYRLMAEPRKFLFGIDHAIHHTVLAMFTTMLRDGDSGKEPSQAHVYLLDPPGVGKTGLIRYVSAAVDARCSLVLGKSDTMPNDIIGGELLDKPTGERFTVLGPIHCNIFGFDEINRTPPKGQAPLLSALEGGFVVINTFNRGERRMEARRYPLYPISDMDSRLYFLALATANPIESEGTYPLSEAERERFSISFSIGYPPRQAEKRIRMSEVYFDGSQREKKIERVMNLGEVLDIARLIVETTRISDTASEYIMRLIENSRPGCDHRESASDELKSYIDEYVKMGNSPRRNFHVEAVARTFAFMRGSPVITVEDIRAVAPLTLEHTLLLQPAARGEHISTRDVIQRIVAGTEVPLS